MTDIRIKNWAKFQHFKDRTPPWVKLYREILDDPDWHDLDGEASKVLVMLWLIASEDESHCGRLPTGKRLAFRLRISEASLNQHLASLSHWLISDDIDVITPRYHGDAPETETETETEKELPNGNSSPSASADEPAPKSDPIPYQAIVDTYNGTMTRLAKARGLTPKRRTLIRGAWRASPERRSIEFWQALFEEYEADDFTNGTGPYSNGHEGWRPTLDYLLRQDVVTRTFERAMDRLERAA